MLTDRLLAGMPPTEMSDEAMITMPAEALRIGRVIAESNGEFSTTTMFPFTGGLLVVTLPRGCIIVVLADTTIGRSSRAEFAEGVLDGLAGVTISALTRGSIVVRLTEGDIIVGLTEVIFDGFVEGLIVELFENMWAAKIITAEFISMPASSKATLLFGRASCSCWPITTWD